MKNGNACYDTVGRREKSAQSLLKLKPVWLVQLIRGNANVCERQCEHQDVWN